MMKRVRAVIRVTELDTLVDVLLRLYKAYAALATDAYLKSIMEPAQMPNPEKHLELNDMEDNW